MRFHSLNLKYFKVNFNTYSESFHLVHKTATILCISLLLSCKPVNLAGTFYKIKTKIIFLKKSNFFTIKIGHKIKKDFMSNRMANTNKTQEIHESDKWGNLIIVIVIFFTWRWKIKLDTYMLSKLIINENKISY